MKTTSEALSRAQEEAMIYRKKLEAGQVRVVRVEPARPEQDKERAEEVRE